jgi:hypothetical protein
MIRIGLCGTALLFLLLASAWAQEQVLTRRATDLRDAPAEVGRSIVALPAQSAVTRTSERHGPWVQVRTAGGASGWVHMFDLGPAPSAASVGNGSSLVSDALRNVGNLFGGGIVRPQTSTTAGIRGLGAADVAQAQPDPEALRQMEDLRPSDADVRSFAERSGWKPAAVGPLPGTARPRGAAPPRRTPYIEEMP